MERARRKASLSSKKTIRTSGAFLWKFSVSIGMIAIVVGLSFVQEPRKQERKTYPREFIDKNLKEFHKASEEGNTVLMKKLQARILDSDFPPVLPSLARGWMNLRYEHSDEAINLLAQFEEDFPTFVDDVVLINMGYLLLEAGDISRAKITFRKLLMRSPHNSRAMIALSETLRAEEGPESEEAHSLLLRASQFDRKALAFIRKPKEVQTSEFRNLYKGFQPGKNGKISVVDVGQGNGLSVIADSLQKAVRKRSPILFKRGIQSLFPTLSSWTNHSYLREQAGSEFIYAMKKEGPMQGFWSQRRLMKFSDFISDQDKYYLISQKSYGSSKLQPPMRHELSKDFKLPYFINPSFLDSVNLWMGKGEIVSRLHHDDNENLATIIQGEKKYILCSPATANVLQVLGEVKLVSANGRIMYHHSDDSHGEHFCLRNLFEEGEVPDDCVEVVASEGDVIYIPGGWFHQVRSAGEPYHQAVNIWWAL